MVKLIERGRVWIGERISGRVPKIPAKHRRLIAGAAALVLALTLAIWAHDASREEALRDWERSHPPSPAIWQHALESHGYHGLSDAGAVQRASRKLPMNIDSENAVWMSPDSEWVAVFSPAQQIYCLDCRARPPESWDFVGAGWSAFDPTLSRLKPPRKPAARPIPRDPRQILY